MLQYNPTVSGSSTVSGSIYVNSPNQTMGQFVGNQNGYVEFSIRNTNTGASASGDIAVYADNGTVTTNYIDMGINNSGLDSAYFYGGTDFGNALDAYVYNVGGNLRIGNATSTAPYSQSFYLFSNATATPNIAITGSQVAINKSSSLNGTLDVNGDTIVTGSLKVSAGITGSFAGTASYATAALTASNATTAITANTASYVVTAQTASYVLNAVSSSFATTSVTSSYANNFNIAGTLTAQTINVQYITSSIEFNTGSTRNGTLTSNTHQFTGSVLVTGSVTSTGVISINGTGGTYGLLDISSTPATSYASLALRGNSRGGEVDFYDGTTVGASIVGGVGTDKSLYFYTSGSSSVKMTIKDSGNVGIGTIAPTKPLYIVGNNSFQGTQLAISASGDSAGIQLLPSPGGVIYEMQSTTGGQYIIYDRTNLAYRMVIASGSGNVGIGTTTPGKALEVYQTGSNTAQIKFSDASTSKGYLGTFSNAVYLNAGGTYSGGWTTDGTNGIAGIVLETSNGGSAIAFGTAASNTSPSERMRITGAGNIGIGTNTPTNLLHVSSSLPRIIADTSTQYAVFNLYAGGSEKGAFYLDNTAKTIILEANGDNTYPLLFRTSGSERMRVTTGGNVGIGTTNPDFGSYGAAEKILGISNTSARARLQLQNSSTGTSGVAGSIAAFNGSTLLANVDMIADGATNSGAWVFYASNAGTNAEKFRIGSAGDITPSGKIVVQNLTDGGTTKGIYLWQAADPNWVIYMSQSGAGKSASGGTAAISLDSRTAHHMRFRVNNNSTQGFIWENNAESVLMSLTGDTGNLFVKGDVTAYSSDKRLKENIVNIPNALDKILSLNGVTYDWNKKALDFGFVPDRLKHDVGVIAQEIQSVLPEATAPAPFDTDHMTGKSISGENYLTVRYDKLVPLLIEAIKEQQAQIDKLNKLLNN